MDSPAAIPGAGAVTPKIRQASAQHPAELETAAQRVIDAAAAADPLLEVVGFELGGGGAGGLLTAVLTFARPSEGDAGAAQGELWFLNPAAPIVLAIPGGGPYVAATGAGFTLTHAVQMSQSAPGVLRYDGAAAATFDVTFGMTANSPSGSTSNRFALLTAGGAPIVPSEVPQGLNTTAPANPNSGTGRFFWDANPGDTLRGGVGNTGGAYTANVQAVNILAREVGTAAAASSGVPVALARVAIVSLPAPDAAAQEPGVLLEQRMAALAPASVLESYTTRAVLPSLSPALVLGSLFSATPE